jgi:phosphoglycerol transferase MdoB-like AlkP superfamily enzyme
MFSPFEFDLKIKKSILKTTFIFLSGLIILVFFARGNFSRLPLSIEDAHISSVDFINKVAINGPLSLNRTIKIRKTFGKDNFNYLKKFGFSTIDEVFQIVFGRNFDRKLKLSEQLINKTDYNEFLEKNPPHVVLVVMESFGNYWNPYHSGNFNILGTLKDKFDEGLFFKNFISSENGTIGSVVSLATNQVIRPGARFLSESEFMKTPLGSAGHLPYRAKGYQTHFVYGGKLGWRDLGKFLRLQNYDQLWGADEIKESLPELQNLSPEELGNEWGIFDEYLYRFIEMKLKTSKTPQFFYVLTTTNHPPFEYPITYKPFKIDLSSNFLEKLTVREDLARKRFEGLQYANQKMSEFIDGIQNSAFKNNTVIALTGDHSFWISKGVGEDEEFQRFSVPFYISLPENLKPTTYDPEAFGSHEDIFPTLYHLTLSDQEFISFGENLLSGNSSAINSSGLIANKEGAYHHGKYWKWEGSRFKRLSPASENKNLLYLKKYREALITLTDLYLKEQKKSKNSDAKNDQQ